MAPPYAKINPPVTVGDAGIPIKGSQIITTQLDFTAGGFQQYQINVALYQAQYVFGIPRSIYINNKNNPNEVDINVAGTNSNDVIPAFSIGVIPIVALANSIITISSNGGASALTTVELYNFPLPPYVYGGLGSFQPGSVVQALAGSMDNQIIRSATLAAGVAQNVFPTVAADRSVTFRNVGDGAGGGDIAFWNVGITATGNFAAGDRLLQVNESIPPTYFRTTQRISFFSTNGTRIEASEWAS